MSELTEMARATVVLAGLELAAARREVVEELTDGDLDKVQGGGGGGWKKQSKGDWPRKEK